MAVRIIVDHLPTTFGDTHLRDLFDRYGTVLSATVIKGPLANSLNFGYVEMETREQAERAVAAINAVRTGTFGIQASLLMDDPG
jgi:RNA recognition motif-containing protein